MKPNSETTKVYGTSSITTTLNGYRYLRFFIKYLGFLHMCPIYWSSSTRSFEVTRSKLTWGALIVHYAYMLFYFPLMFWSLSTYQSVIRLSTLLVSLTFLWGKVIFSFLYLNLMLFPTSTAAFLNCLTKLDRNIASEPSLGIVDKERKFYWGLQNGLIGIGLGTIVFVPSIQLLYLVTPCFGPYWGTILYLNKVTGECTPAPILIRILLMLLDMYTCSTLTTHITVSALFMFGQGVNFFNLSLLYITRLVRLGRRKSIFDVIKIFRCLRILAELMNDSFRSVGLPMLFSGASVGFILALVICIRTGPKMLSSPQLLVFPIISVDSFVVIFVLSSLGSQIYLKSGILIQQLHRIFQGPGRRKIKLTLKTLKSLTPIRVSFGSNYVDRVTPLKLLDFCLAQTVSLLLLTS